MFEFAFAKAIALEFNEDIYLDVSSYKSYKIRDFSLQHLKLVDSIRYIEDAKLPMTHEVYLKLSQKIYHVLQKIVMTLNKRNRIGKRTFELLTQFGLYYNFDVYHYDLQISNCKVKCLYGYFQSEKYFQKHKKQVLQVLKVTTPLTNRAQKLLNDIISCNATGISIRLGNDYINSEFDVCKDDYFYRGMDFIYERHKDTIFYIFSDCVNKVREKFKFKYTVKYIEGFKDYESLRLLYSCKHFVIANSSFSWWGAYLSSNEDKIIIAPNKWRKNSQEVPDIYYDRLTLLDV